MGSEGINFTGVTVLLSSDSEGTSVQARKDIKVDTPGEIRACQVRDTASGEAKRR